MLDFYLFSGFDLPRDSAPQRPEFSVDTDELQGLCNQNGVKPGKTILLSPHTTGNNINKIPSVFWENLAHSLQEDGYEVLTNCAGKELAVNGTSAAFIPYQQLVPFLELAGGFIGIRSGLCEVISSAACRKVIIHTYHNEWWPEGFSIPFTGLNNMGLCDDAIELEYDGNQIEELQKSVLKVF